MTAEELKAKRLALGFRSRNALAKALGSQQIRRGALGIWPPGCPRSGYSIFSNDWKNCGTVVPVKEVRKELWCRKNISTDLLIRWSQVRSLLGTPHQLPVFPYYFFSSIVSKSCPQSVPRIVSLR